MDTLEYIGGAIGLAMFAAALLAFLFVCLSGALSFILDVLRDLESDQIDLDLERLDQLERERG
jgi:hypothetical protein